MIEMLTTIAVLVIVLGLMVSLARYVRDRSAQQLTRDLLGRLEGLMELYMDHSGGNAPPVPSLFGAQPTSGPGERAVIARNALRNNEQTIRKLIEDFRSRTPGAAEVADPFAEQPISIYDDDAGILRDSWGSPIVFMPGQHPLIGLAPSRSGQDQSFFFSAGPDRNYLTRDDNLYSYETLPTE